MWGGGGVRAARGWQLHCTLQAHPARRCPCPQAAHHTAAALPRGCTARGALPLQPLPVHCSSPHTLTVPDHRRRLLEAIGGAVLRRVPKVLGPGRSDDHAACAAGKAAATGDGARQQQQGRQQSGPRAEAGASSGSGSSSSPGRGWAPQAGPSKGVGATPRRTDGEHHSGRVKGRDRAKVEVFNKHVGHLACTQPDGEAGGGGGHAAARVSGAVDARLHSRAGSTCVLRSRQPSTCFGASLGG